MIIEEINEILAQHKLWIESNCQKGAQANFRNTNLRYNDFRDKTLIGADFSYADLEGVCMTRADLYHSRFEATFLKGANLVNANLRSANLQHANLAEANLQGASLCFANLHGCYLRGANLSNTDLRGANLYGAYITESLMPNKMLKIGKLYMVENQHVPYDGRLVCLISINKDNTLDLLDGKAGKIYRRESDCIKYSFVDL